MSDSSEVRFYQVGGSVRDEILNIPSKDLDYSCEATSYGAMRNAIIDRGGEIFLETPEFFTIRAKVPNMGACDFVLARRDGQYSDNRRPDKVEHGTLLDDLARRDFTMNAIAKAEDGSCIDPFGGLFDIQNRMIRCVGDTERRFSEDYLRILRAIRFSVTKQFDVSDDILNYLMERSNIEKLKEVAIERVREELYKAFRHNSLKTMRLLMFFGIDEVLFSDSVLWLEPTLKPR